jgi:putative ABC transport system permease protein
MSEFWDNVKHAVRMFRMNPGFTLAAVAALALGIGINTAIFTVVDAVLLKPLTYPDADRIVEFMITSPQGNAAVASIPKFVSLQQQTSVFQDLAAYDLGGPGFNLTGDRPEQVHGIHVTQAHLRHRRFAIDGHPLWALSCHRRLASGPQLRTQGE